jgi:drug/metabolite transporter (DMT)-like permease
VPPRIFAVWCAVCLLWSSSFLFLRVGVTDIPPLTFASLRLALALSVLLPVALARNWLARLSRREWTLIVCTGVLILGVNYALLFWGAQFIPSGLVAILQSTTPPLALGVGWALGSEDVTPRKLAALAISIVGVFVIFSDEAAIPRGAAMLASAAVFLGACSLVVGYVCLKTYGKHLHPGTVITIQTVAAAVPLAVAAFLLEGWPTTARWSPAAITALVYLGVVASVIAFGLNYWLLRRIDASLMLLMGVAEVPVAVALGVIFLDEQLHARTLTGAGCVALGVALIATKKN